MIWGPLFCKSVEIKTRIMKFIKAWEGAERRTFGAGCRGGSGPALSWWNDKGGEGILLVPQFTFQVSTEWFRWWIIKPWMIKPSSALNYQTQPWIIKNSPELTNTSQPWITKHDSALDYQKQPWMIKHSSELSKTALNDQTQLSPATVSFISLFYLWFICNQLFIYTYCFNFF